MGNKSDELKCLNIAISECLKQHGDSKKIGKMISGAGVSRQLEENPDFVKYSQYSDKRNILLGIEHFAVDHFSRENNRRQKVTSFGLPHGKKVVNDFKAIRDNYKETHFLTDQDIGVIERNLENHIKLQTESTYNMFINTFKYCLDKHISSVERYYKELNRIDNKTEKAIAFLIEIHSCFNLLSFHDSKGVHSYKETVPLFEEIIELLEPLSSKKVQYVILCFGNIIYNDNNVKVIALRTNNIRSQLKKRRIEVYNYAGYDMFLKGFSPMCKDVNVDINIDNSNIDFTIKSQEHDDTTKTEMNIEAAKRAYIFRQNGENYASNEMVDALLKVFEDFFPILLTNRGGSNLNVLKRIDEENGGIVGKRCKELEKILSENKNEQN